MCLSPTSSSSRMSLSPAHHEGPAWLDTDKYAARAKPDIEGQPGLKQMRVMVQKLLADRFQLNSITRNSNSLCTRSPWPKAARSLP